MEARVQILSLLASSGLLVFIFELVRRKKLKEKYSLLWIFTALALMVLSVSRGLINHVGKMMGIYYPPSALFLLAFLFLLLITLQFSVVISKLSDRNKALSQEVALLKLKVEEIERKG